MYVCDKFDAIYKRFKCVMPTPTSNYVGAIKTNF